MIYKHTSCIKSYITDSGKSQHAIAIVQWEIHQELLMLTLILIWMKMIFKYSTDLGMIPFANGKYKTPRDLP